jgi:hypothetical protein
MHHLPQLRALNLGCALGRCARHAACGRRELLALVAHRSCLGVPFPSCTGGTTWARKASPRWSKRCPTCRSCRSSTSGACSRKFAAGTRRIGVDSRLALILPSLVSLSPFRPRPRLDCSACSFNGIGDEGLTALAQALHYVPQLQTLNLECALAPQLVRVCVNLFIT